jgi:hypothetical protein
LFGDIFQVVGCPVDVELCRQLSTKIRIVDAENIAIALSKDVMRERERNWFT